MTEPTTGKLEVVCPMSPAVSSAIERRLPPSLPWRGDLNGAAEQVGKGPGVLFDFSISIGNLRPSPQDRRTLVHSLQGGSRTPTVNPTPRGSLRRRRPHPLPMLRLPRTMPITRRPGANRKHGRCLPSPGQPTAVANYRCWEGKGSSYDIVSTTNAASGRIVVSHPCNLHPGRPIAVRPRGLSHHRLRVVQLGRRDEGAKVLAARR